MSLEAAATPRATLLVVDDVEHNLVMLGGILDTRYQLRLASSGAQALQMLRTASLPDLVLLDVVMPGMDGYAVCRRIKDDARTRDLPVVFLTALDDAIDEELGLGLGAADYIAKPVHPPTMFARIEAQLRLKAAADALRAQNQRIAHAAAQRLDAAEAQSDALVATLAALVHPRELEGGQQMARAQAYLQALLLPLQAGRAGAAALAPATARLIARAAPLRDIGMVDVPDRILFKAGPLTREEFGTMALHAERGRAAIAQAAQQLGRPTPLLDLAADIAHAHHERWDGAGYPRGLAGEAIALGARLVAVVDTYEALTSGRLYRLPLAHAQAVAQIAGQRGTQFDPRIVDVFLAVADRFAQIAHDLADRADEARVRLRAVEAIERGTA